jgi:hypothetical protein
MDTPNNYRDSDNYRDVLARAHLHIANEMAKLGVCDIHDLVKLLLESDDLATANKVLGPILLAASGFYNRHDDDASCRALRMAHGIITVNINGPDKYMTEIFADMAVVARFLFEWLEGCRNDTPAVAPVPESENGGTVISLKRELIARHLEDLTEHMTHLKALTPATRTLLEQITDLTGSGVQ